MTDNDNDNTTISTAVDCETAAAFDVIRELSLSAPPDNETDSFIYISSNRNDEFGGAVSPCRSSTGAGPGPDEHEVIGGADVEAPLIPRVYSLDMDNNDYMDTVFAEEPLTVPMTFFSSEQDQPTTAHASSTPPPPPPPCPPKQTTAISWFSDVYNETTFTSTIIAANTSSRDDNDHHHHDIQVDDTIEKVNNNNNNNNSKMDESTAAHDSLSLSLSPPGEEATIGGLTNNNKTIQNSSNHTTNTDEETGGATTMIHQSSDVSSDRNNNSSSSSSSSCGSSNKNGNNIVNNNNDNRTVAPAAAEAEAAPPADSSSSSCDKLIFGIKKTHFILACIALTFAIFFFVRTAFSIWGWVTIPKLNSEIEALNAKVVRLTSEVNHLQLENDELQNANKNYLQLWNNQTLLSPTMTTTTSKKDKSSAQNSSGNTQDDVPPTKMNATSLPDDDENEQYYSDLDEELQVTTDELSSEVNQLQELIQNLTRDKVILTNRTMTLTNEVQYLQDVNADLLLSVNVLNTSITNLTSEMKNLNNLNTDLYRILLFLNEDAVYYDSSLDTNSLTNVTSFLSQQIITNRATVVQAIQNRWLQHVAYWDCSFRDAFRNASFIIDQDAPIIDQDNILPLVLDYVEEHVLLELCLNITDFKVFLDNNYRNDADLFDTTTTMRISANDLYQAVADYITAAMTYYFPDTTMADNDQEAVGSSGGLTSDDWALASYKCSGLPTFRFTPAPVLI